MCIVLFQVEVEITTWATEVTATHSLLQAMAQTQVDPEMGLLEDHPVEEAVVRELIQAVVAQVDLPEEVLAEVTAETAAEANSSREEATTVFHRLQVEIPETHRAREAFPVDTLCPQPAPIHGSAMVVLLNRCMQFRL